MKKCPYCAEEIKDEAIKCKHCGSEMPEVQQKAEKEQMQAEIIKAEEIRQMDGANAEKVINIGYGFLFFGFIAGIFLMIINKLPWYIIPIIAYALWSLYWGIQIVHRPVKNFYNSLFIFGTGVVDLFFKQIGLRLAMYLFAIPIVGLIAGFLGGAIYKQLQFSRLTQKDNKLSWMPIGMGIVTFIALIGMIINQNSAAKVKQSRSQTKIRREKSEITKEVSPTKKSTANLQQNLSTPNTATGTQNQPTLPENVQTIAQPIQEKITPSPCIAAIDKIEVGTLINPDGSIVNPGKSFAAKIGAIEIAAYISSGKKGEHVNATLYFDSEGRKISNPVQKIISEDGDAILQFSLSSFYGNWPTGNYRIVISIEENETSKEITYVIVDSETKEKEEINKIYQGASQSGEGYTSLPLSKPTAVDTIRNPTFTNQQMKRNTADRDIN